MTVAPLPPGLRPGGAADETGVEHSLYVTSAAQSQGTADLADFRLQRAVTRLHRLGPRPLYEMLVELGAQRMIRSEIEALVERYASLDPGLLAAVAADRFPASPMRIVGGAP